VGGFEYSNSTLQHFAMSEGRVLAGAGTYQYFLKDHLGNVRMTITPGVANSDKIVQQDFYYPFGMRQAIKMPGLGNKKLYNGKELVDQNGLNWYHYGVRWYDPTLSRWTTMDPADELYSPYCYVGNRPVMLIDPDGKQIYFAFNFKLGAIIDIHEPITDFTLYGNWGSLTIFGFDTRTGTTVPWQKAISTGSGFGLMGGAYKLDAIEKPLPFENSLFQRTKERETTESLSYGIAEIKTITIEHITTNTGFSDSPEIKKISSKTSGDISLSVHADIGVGLNLEVGIDNTRVLPPVIYQTSGVGIDATSTVVRGSFPYGD